MKNSQNRSLYIFEWPSVDVFVAKYIYIFAFFGWIVVLLQECFIYGNSSSDSALNFPIVSLFFLLPVLAFLSLLFFAVTFKFTYKIVFDYEKKIIKSFLVRKRKPLVYNISDLQLVKFNWYIYFYYKDGTSIWYKTNYNSEFLEFLNKKKIPKVWGWFGKLFLKNEYLNDKVQAEKNDE